MNKLSILFMLIICSGLCFAESGRPIDWNDKGLKWFDYGEGMNEILKTGKPGLFIIYADWCPTCKTYARLFYDKEVIESLSGVVLIRTNKDLFPRISQQYNFDGEYIPRTFALNNRGQIMQNFYIKDRKYIYYLPSKESDYLSEFAKLIKKYGKGSN